MKKFILLFSILLLTACSSSNLKSLKVSDLKSKIDNKETFILYLMDNSNESQSLKKSDSDQTSLNNLITYEDANIIIFIKDGKESSVLSRVTNLYITPDDLKEELKLQGYLQ